MTITRKLTREKGMDERQSAGKTIEDMVVGESAYTVPWALAFDLNKGRYLNVGCKVESKLYGTMEMSITRVGMGLTDYYVDSSKVHYTWHLHEDPLGFGIIESDKMVYLDGQK